MILNFVWVSNFIGVDCSAFYSYSSINDIVTPESLFSDLKVYRETREPNPPQLLAVAAPPRFSSAAFNRQVPYPFCYLPGCSFHSNLPRFFQSLIWGILTFNLLSKISWFWIFNATSKLLVKASFHFHSFKFQPS